jgi:hypothetical protein
MPDIPDVGFKFNPPASKHSPFPIILIKSSFYLPPFHYKLTKIGSFLLALPTA